MADRLMTTCPSLNKDTTLYPDAERQNYEHHQTPQPNVQPQLTGPEDVKQTAKNRHWQYAHDKEPEEREPLAHQVQNDHKDQKAEAHRIA
jgi:hypothetical protein